MLNRLISIHAPRVGSDFSNDFPDTDTRDFNPRSPRGERREARNTDSSDTEFQSTLPAWGATRHIARCALRADFNPRSPRGERQRSHASQVRRRISIHAPRVGSDPRSRHCLTASMTFQSTLPAWGATRAASRRACVHGFQSTLPAWGATTCKRDTDNPTDQFQSTLPAWGATLPLASLKMHVGISIHAPRVGSDGFAPILDRFNVNISIHAPRVGSDVGKLVHIAVLIISIHAPRVGSDADILL